MCHQMRCVAHPLSPCATHHVPRTAYQARAGGRHLPRGPAAWCYRERALHVTCCVAANPRPPSGRSDAPDSWRAWRGAGPPTPARARARCQARAQRRSSARPPPRPPPCPASNPPNSRASLPSCPPTATPLAHALLNGASLPTHQIRRVDAVKPALHKLWRPVQLASCCARLGRRARRRSRQASACLRCAAVAPPRLRQQPDRLSPSVTVRQVAMGAALVWKVQIVGLVWSRSASRLF